MASPLLSRLRTHLLRRNPPSHSPPHTTHPTRRRRFLTNLLPPKKLFTLHTAIHSYVRSRDDLDYFYNMHVPPERFFALHNIIMNVPT